MKVIILAGGWGTRLGQQNEDIPKPMVPIGNKPIIWHIMKYYSEFGWKKPENKIKIYFLKFFKIQNYLKLIKRIFRAYINVK